MSDYDPIKGKATSFDIAYRAGVSQSTVSRALRDSDLVNYETRNKIKAIAKELNYKVDKNASNLRTQQSSTIALLLFEENTTDDSHINPFFLDMLGSITRACSSRGYDLLVSFQQLSNDWHADYADCHKADGIILLGYGNFQEYKEKLNQLELQNTNFVLWGSTDVGREGVVIGCDNFQGGYDLTQHLIKLGRKNIAYIGGVSSASPEFKSRYLGCVKAIKDNHLTVNKDIQIDAITSEQAGYDAVIKLLKLNQSFDAIFCASDLIAVGTIKALREHDIEIPQQVAIVGYDDIPLAEFMRPGLTTAKQDTKEAGELLVESLLNQIKNQPNNKTLLSAKVVIRESCGAVI